MEERLCNECMYYETLNNNDVIVYCRCKYGKFRGVEPYSLQKKMLCDKFDSEESYKEMKRVEAKGW